MKYLKLVVLSSVLLVLVSCAKDKLTNNWSLKKYEVNNVNQTINSNTGLEMDFYKDNTFKRTWIIGGFQIPETGSWVFADGKKKILLTKQDGGVESYTVTKLTYKELKAERMDGSDKHVYSFEGK